MAKGKIAAMQRAVLSGPKFAQDQDRPAVRVDDDTCRAFMLSHGMDYRGCRRLEALGVPGRFVAVLGARLAIGQARVALCGRGTLWEPEGPDARLLLACFDEGGLCDVAAGSTSSPDQVALRLGVGWCLGFDRIEDAERAVLAERRVRLRVFADPMEWLRAGPSSSSEAIGQFKSPGIVVLDWAAALPRLRMLGERVTLECDAGAGEQLRARLKVGGLPRVSERAPVARQEAA